MRPLFFALGVIALVILVIITLEVYWISANAATSGIGGNCQPYNCNPVPCAVAPSIMCYTAFNVNLNTTVQLANPLSYPNTTIDPNGCHIGIVAQIQNVVKEKQQSPEMYNSDAKTERGDFMAPLLWCGIEK